MSVLGIDPVELLRQWSVTIGAAAVIVTGLGVIWKKAVRPAAKSVADTYRFCKEVLELVKYELQPNGGGSLYDTVKALETKVSAVRKDQIRNKAENDARHSDNQRRLVAIESEADRRLKVFELIFSILPPELRDPIARIRAEHPAPQGDDERTGE